MNLAPLRRPHGFGLVTDDAIHVLGCSKIFFKPREVVATLPRQTQLGPVSGIWARIDLAGDSYWVHKRFHDEINAADKDR